MRWALAVCGPCPAVASTPCPACGGAIDTPEDEEKGSCPHCGQRVRFLEAPERPCPRCGAQVVLPPHEDLARCPRCRRAVATDPTRPLEARARCPRCRRTLRVDADAEEAVCPHCGDPMALEDPA